MQGSVRFQQLEKVLDRVKERRVGAVEKHDRTVLERCGEHVMVMVDGGVVHEEHDAPSHEIGLRANALKQTSDEMLEHIGVNTAINELRGEHSVSADCSDETERVRLLFQSLTILSKLASELRTCAQGFQICIAGRIASIRMLGPRK